MGMVFEGHKLFLFPAPVREPPNQVPDSIPIPRKGHPLSVRCPHWGFTRPRGKRQPGQGTSLQIIGPDVRVFLLDPDGKSIAVRRKARIQIGPQGRAQRFRCAFAIHPNERPFEVLGGARNINKRALVGEVELANADISKRPDTL